MLVERVFNGLMEVQGFVERLEIRDVEPLGVEFSEQTKVSVMTTEEIREEIGLEPLAEAEKMQKVDAEMEAETRVCEAFASCGENVNSSSIIYTRPVRFETQQDADHSEDTLKRFGFGSEAFDLAVLDQLKKDPSLSWAAIAEVMKATVDEILESVRNLAALDYLKVGVATVIDSTQKVSEITTRGNRALETAEPLDVALKIRYRYIKSGEAAGASIIETTRDFCRNLVNLSNSGKTWSNAEIQQIGMSEGRNVWQRKGGFWTRKGGQVTTPYCRHVWEQLVVKA